jgi:hypothetical protein
MIWLSIWLLGLARAAVLKPDSNYIAPIDVDCVNANEVTNYWFHFDVPVSLAYADLLYVTLPSEFVTVTATGCKVTENYQSTTPTYTSCTFSASKPVITVTIPKALSGKFTLKLEGVKNPEQFGNTGSIGVSTKSPKSSQYSSENRNFATLGFAAKLASAASNSANIDSSYSGWSSEVSASSTYAFRVTVTSNIDAGTWFRIKLPSGWSRQTGLAYDCLFANYTSAQVVTPGTFNCRTTSDYVYVEGLASFIDASDVTKSQFSVVVPKIINPERVYTEGEAVFVIDVVDQGTTNVIQRMYANCKQITPGTLTSFSSSTLSSLASFNGGNEITVIWSFAFSHAIPSGGSITMTINNSNFVTSGNKGCFIVKGPTSLSSDVVASCSASSKTLTISSLSSFIAKTEIKVQATVSLSTANDDSLVVYSSSTSGVVDRGTQTVLSRTTAPLMASLAVSYGALTATSTGSVTYTFKPQSTLTAGASINLQYSTGFTLSTPTCTVTPNGGASSVVSCSATSNVVTLTTTGSITSASTSTIAISSFTYPKVESNVEDVYEFCMTTYQSSALQGSSCITQQLSPVTLSASHTLVGDSTEPDVYMPFTVNIVPPVSIAASLTTRVDVTFPTMDNTNASNGFALNLGITNSNPSCKFTSVTGSCALTAATTISSATSATMTFKGLLTYASGTADYVRLIVKSPQTAALSYDYTIKLGYVQSGIFKVIGTRSASISTVAAAASWTTSTLTVRSTKTYNVSTSLDLSLRNPSGTNVVSGFPVFFVFPTTWDISKVTSVTAGSAFTNLELFANDYAPVIACKAATTGHISNTGVTTVTIAGMVNPPVLTATSPIRVGLINASKVQLAYGSTGNIDNSVAATITTASVSADILDTSFPGVNYTFSVTLVNDLPAQGMVKITLPSAITSLSNASCSTTAAAYNSGQVSCSRSGSVFTFTNLAAVTKTNALKFTISRLDNPATSSLTPFQVDVLRSDSTIQDSVSTLSLTLTTNFSKGQVSISRVWMEPQTKKATNADFWLSLTTSHKIPEGAAIQITIPYDFAGITSTDCSLNYALSLCSASGHFITLNTATDIAAGAEVVIGVNGAFTVPDVTMTSSFYVKVTYQSVTLDEFTGNLTNNKDKLTPQTQSKSMVVETIDFFPRNEGEDATYRFQLTVPADISSTSKIVVWYPTEFDPSITTSDSMQCWASPSEFVGSIISCSTSAFRRVEITGFNTISASLPFSIYMSHIKNPPEGKIGKFRFAVEDSTGQTLFYQVNSGNFAIADVPQALKLRDITATSKYARVKSTWTFEFSPVSTIPSDTNKGKIFLDFPAEFTFKNMATSTGWVFPCKTWLIVNNAISSTNWNDNIKCVNYNSNRVEITGGKEFTAASNKYIRIQISEFPAPQTTTATQSMKVITYNGVTQEVIDRTYTLLSYPVSFTLPLQSEEVKVNGNSSISVIRGTASAPVKLTSPSDSPVRVDIKLSGVMPLIPSARLHPATTLEFKVEQTELSFSVSVPIEIPPGSYNFEWTKSGDDYYPDVPDDEVYAPLMTTTINVVNAQSTISFSTFSYIPIGGHGYPITVTLANAPHKQLFLSPLITEGARVRFDPEILTFNSGQTTIDLMIYADYEEQIADIYTLSWELSGNDAAAYVTPSSVSIRLTGTDTVVPSLSNVFVSSTARKTANIRMILSEPGTLYYQVQLKGTPMPTASDLVELFKKEKSARLVVLNKDLDFTLTLSGLAAGTEYVLFLTLADNSDNLATVSSITFTTASYLTGAKFVIDFTNYNPDTDGLEHMISNVVLPELSKGFSVKPSRLQAYGISKEVTSRRRLQENFDASLYSKNALVVLLGDDKYSDLVDASTIVKSTTVAEINQFLNKKQLTATSISLPIYLTNKVPIWTFTGSVWETSESSITAAGSLYSNGYLHMVIINRGGPEPSAQQVVWGLDGENNQVRHISTFCDSEAISDLSYATYEGLVPSTKYDVYIAATNDDPGNNKAVSAEKISFPGVRTDKDVDCETEDCDLYYVKDDEDTAVWVGLTGLGLVFFS